MLSPISRVEKNKLTSDSVWLTCLEIHITSMTDIIRIVNNNEDINWNGELWQMFPFDFDEINESSSGETSQVVIKVSNVKNQIGQHVREYDAWCKQNSFQPIKATLYILNSKDLDNTEPIYKLNLVLNKPHIGFLEVTFTLSAKNLYGSVIPRVKMYPNSCRFVFKSTQCAYAGDETKCDKTLKRCQELSNSSRFGGFPTIGNKGVSV